MSKTFDKVCSAIADGRVHVSEHAYDEAVDADEAVHSVWAFDEGAGRAILVTVYRPDPDRWSEDFAKRRSKT